MRQTPNLRNGAVITVRGFESHTRRQMVASLVKAGTSTREINRTAEAARFANPSIRLLVVELKRRFHSDLSQLSIRNAGNSESAAIASAISATNAARSSLDARDQALDGMYLPIEKAKTIIRLLLEGNSVSSVERATEIHHTTILKLLVLAGERCERIMAAKLRNIEVRDVECDEVWIVYRQEAKTSCAPRIINFSETATCSSE